MSYFKFLIFFFSTIINKICSRDLQISAFCIYRYLHFTLYLNFFLELGLYFMNRDSENNTFTVTYYMTCFANTPFLEFSFDLWHPGQVRVEGRSSVCVYVEHPGCSRTRQWGLHVACL